MGIPEATVEAITSPRRSNILVVNDDPVFLETAGLLLRKLQYRVYEAPCGTVALEIARKERVDLVLLDQKLPDISGLEVAKRFRSIGVLANWILISGFMDFELAAEAGKLGALSAVAVPCDLETVVHRAFNRIGQRNEVEWPTPPFRSRLRAPRSAAERWARYVLVGCDSEIDLPTTGAWASFAGVGHSTLREACRIVGVSGYSARNLTRVLRVLSRNTGRFGNLGGELVFCDERTLGGLLRRSGLHQYRSDQISVDTFLGGQHFLPIESAAAKALRLLVDELG